jgi:uncharacterized LabA/DUF88 family protein
MQIAVKKHINNFTFIDSQNLNLGIKSQGWELDYEKFIKFVKNKYRVSEAFIFIGYVKKYQNLYSYLQKIGYNIIFKPTLVTADGKVKGNCDAELVLQSMIDYEKYDKAVLVSGDGDFCCLIKYLKSQNKLARVIIPNKRSYSSLLKRFKDDMTYMTDMKNELKI